jgi:aminopeptidase N
MAKWFVAVVALAATAWATPIDFAELFEPPIVLDQRQATSNIRLNEDVLPIHYDIHLTPYFDGAGDRSFTFDGRVEILVHTTRANVVQIVMHANEMTIADDWVVYEEGNPTNPIPHPPLSYDQATYKLTLNLNRALRQGVNYIVVINYVGRLSDAMSGFYRSYYMENNVRKWLGTTQFQSTGARRAFPCFDEPKFKATFKLSMDRLNTYKPTLSNTKIEASRASTIAGRTVDVFKKTPVMSSYLIAFIVSEFDGRQDALGTNGLYARPQAYDQTEYSHTFLTNVLKSFDSFTDYAYLAVPELEKLDQVSQKKSMRCAFECFQSHCRLPFRTFLLEPWKTGG